MGKEYFICSMNLLQAIEEFRGTILYDFCRNLEIEHLDKYICSNLNYFICDLRSISIFWTGGK